MLKYSKEFLKKIKKIEEEIILIIIIILNILDFAGLLNPDFDYGKKILSWTALGYLFYKANLTKLFFGFKNKKIDLLIILSFFILSFKNIIGHAISTINFFKTKSIEYWANIYHTNTIPKNSEIINVKSNLNNVDLTGVNTLDLNTSISHLADKLTFTEFLSPNNLILNVSNNISNTYMYIEPKFLVHRWFNFILENIEFFADFSLIFGSLLLCFISFYCALKFNIKSPSFLNIFNISKKPKNNFKIIFTRFIIIYLCLNMFFIIVFNLVMEWLAIAIDAPLLVIVLFFYLLFWIKHHNKFNTESFIFRVGNFGNSFYNRFINLFKTKKGIIIAISGMLVLHLLTEIGIFIIPYLTGLINPLYFNQLQGSHTPIFSFFDLFNSSKESLFIIDFLTVNTLIDKLLISYIYLTNVIFILSILIIPALIWYSLFKDKEIKINCFFPAIFFASFASFILAPIFFITRISKEGLIGVSIQTQPLTHGAIFNFMSIFLISISIGFLFFYVIFSENLLKKSIYLIYFIALIFFSWYMVLFFLDLFIYYTNFLKLNYLQLFTIFNLSKLFLFLIMLLFFTLSIIFYFLGYFSMIYLFIKKILNKNK
ncbi:MAG: hypothetical protein ACOC3X_03500 [Nanoarchaeota archaeon]